MKVDKRIVYTIISIMIVISGLIGYSYINSDLNSSSSVTVNKYNCNQSNLYDRLACMSVMDNVKSKYVSSDMGIDFSNVSSDTNGKGVYTFSSTAGDEYPVYYYRGAVEDNNVKFAGFCWKIVRTTETGGTKLMYSGIPTNEGYCINNDNIGSYSYNNNSNSISQVGYMYGEEYIKNIYTVPETETNIIYGNDVEYDLDSKEYTLIDTFETTDWTTDKSTISSKYHYTCRTNSNKCQNVYYIYYVHTDNTYTYTYITLTKGENIDGALDNMFPEDNDKRNVKNSLAKEKIDLWYSNNMTSYTNQLEDAVWCNNRTISNKGGWNKDIDTSNRLWFIFANDRKIKNNECPYLDSFTTDIANGNGKLKYPVGLVTIGELNLSGFVVDKINDDISYGNNFMTMTSRDLYANHGSAIHVVDSEGVLKGHQIITPAGIRPSISLNHSQVISSGDGTKNNPYVIE